MDKSSKENVFVQDEKEIICESVGPVVDIKENKYGVIRLHQLTYFIKSNLKTKLGEYRSPKFKPPKGMCKFEIFKVISHLCDLIERDLHCNFMSIESVDVLESLLEIYHFKKLDSMSRVPCSDFYFVDDQLDVFQQTSHSSKLFKWYVADVSREEIVSIYKKLNLPTDDFVMELVIEEPNTLEN